MKHYLRGLEVLEAMLRRACCLVDNERGDGNFFPHPSGPTENAADLAFVLSLLSTMARSYLDSLVDSYIVELKVYDLDKDIREWLIRACIVRAIERRDREFLKSKDWKSIDISKIDVDIRDIAAETYVTRRLAEAKKRFENNEKHEENLVKFEEAMFDMSIDTDLNADPDADIS